MTYGWTVGIAEVVETYITRGLKNLGRLISIMPIMERLGNDRRLTAHAAADRDAAASQPPPTWPVMNP